MTYKFEYMTFWYYLGKFLLRVFFFFLNEASGWRIILLIALAIV